jgi:hypothetical protein
MPVSKKKKFLTVGRIKFRRTMAKHGSREIRVHRITRVDVALLDIHLDMFETWSFRPSALTAFLAAAASASPDPP